MATQIQIRRDSSTNWQSVNPILANGEFGKETDTGKIKNVPGSQSIVTYNNAVIAETKELMSNEVDNMLQNSRSIVDSVPYHNNVIESCEEILKNLNPRFAKEKERDEDISNLKNKIGGLETKMDKLISILSKETK